MLKKSKGISFSSWFKSVLRAKWRDRSSSIFKGWWVDRQGEGMWEVGRDAHTRIIGSELDATYIKRRREMHISCHEWVLRTDASVSTPAHMKINFYSTMVFDAFHHSLLHQLHFTRMIRQFPIASTRWAHHPTGPTSPAFAGSNHYLCSLAWISSLTFLWR